MATTANTKTTTTSFPKIQFLNICLFLQKQNMTKFWKD